MCPGPLSSPAFAAAASMAACGPYRHLSHWFLFPAPSSQVRVLSVACVTHSGLPSCPAPEKPALCHTSG